MKLRKRTVFFILLAAMLVLCFGALADSPLGVQTGAHYQSIRLSSSSNAATVLDYLEDYLDTEMAAKMILAEDLANYSGKIEQNRDALSRANNDQLTEWLRVYDSVPVGGTMTARELAVQSVRELTETRNELDFYATKLAEYLTKDEDLRAQITGGYCTQLEIDQLKAELDIVDREAEKYRMAALKKLTGNAVLTETVRRADAQLSVFNHANPYQGTVRAIQGLGSHLERNEALAIEKRENNDIDPHHITVISKKQVGIQIFDPTAVDSQGFPIDVGLPGVKITMTAEMKDSSGKPLAKPDPSKTQTVTTDAYGLAVFEVANYYPDDNRRIQVYVSYEDAGRTGSDTVFRRRDLGFCHFAGGDVIRLDAEVDNGDPYLVSLMFEDLDMLTMDEGMYMEKNNTTTYAVRGEVEMNGRTDVQYHVKMLDMGAEAFNGTAAPVQTLFDVVVKPGGASTFEVKSQWLNKTASASAVAFRDGHKLLVEMGAEALNGASDQRLRDTHGLAPAFHYWDSPTGHDWFVDTYEDDEVPTGTYLDNFVGQTGIKLPASIPVVGGAEFSITNLLTDKWFAKHPTLAKMKIQIDFPQTILFAFNTTLSDPSKDDEGRVYASKGQRAIENRHKENNDKGNALTKNMNQGIADAKMIADDNSVYSASTFSYGFTSYFQAQLSLSMTPPEVNGGDLFQAKGSINVGIIFDLTYDVTFYPTWFFYVNFNALLRINFGFGSNMTLEFDRATREAQRPDFDDILGFQVSVHLEFTLTAGAGVKGIAEIGVRGAAWLDFYLRISWTPVPATSFKVGLRAEGFLTAFFLKWSASIIDLYTILEPEDEFALSRATTPPSGDLLRPASAVKALQAANEEDPEAQMKVVALDRALLAFYPDRSSKPQRLMMRTIWRDKEKDGDRYNFDEPQAVYTVPEEWDYLYDFDVSYDPHYSAETTGEDYRGIYFVVTMGNWAGGVDVGQGKADYWQQDTESARREYYRQVSANKDGQTIFGNFEFDIDDSYRDPKPPAVMYTHIEVMESFALQEPSIVTGGFYHDSHSITSRRWCCACVVGIELQNDTYLLKEYAARLTYTSVGPHRPSINKFILAQDTLASQNYRLPGYWILPTPIMDTEDSDAPFVRYDLSTYALLIQNASGMELVCHDPDPFTAYRGYDERYVTRVPIEAGGKVVSSVSDPYYLQVANNVELNDNSMIFMLADGDPVRGKAEKSMDGVADNLTLLIFDFEDIQMLPSLPGRFHVYQYDLDVNGLDVGMLHVPSQEAIYFYWGAMRTECKEDGEEITHNYIMASMLDRQRNIVSPAFKLAEIKTNMNSLTSLKILRCFEADKQGTPFAQPRELIAAFHTDQTYTESVQLPLTASILAFAPEYSAIGQGQGFNIFSRIENTGALVMQQLNYTVKASPEGGGTPIILQSATIDMRYPEMSSVTHYDYLQQDHPELRGKSLKELQSVLNRMNDTRYVAKGEYAVYRIPDNHDHYNGNLLHVITRSVDENGKPAVKGSAVQNYFFMPGNIATYKSYISGSQGTWIDEWAGDYTLSIETTGAKFSMGLSENAPVYEAVLSDDGTHFDFYSLDENGNRVTPANGEKDGALALFSPELPAKVRENAVMLRNTGVNTARNDTLMSGNQRYLTMEQNDYDLSARQFMRNGVDSVAFTLRNEAPEIAPDFTPRLIAKATYLGKETNTGWVLTLNRSNIKDGFTRSVTVPLKDIVNGQRFEELNVYLVTTASDDPADFMDTNSYNNHVTLYLDHPLRILCQPQSVTVEEGKDAVFTVVPEAADRCRYQWAVYLPDGTMAQLPGETGQTLTIKNAQRSRSGYAYCCLVSVPDGRTVRSDWATLTVTAKVPKTGDAVNPFALAAVGLAAAAACAVLVFTLTRKRKKA